MAKYYLNAMLNDEVILTITSGKLNEVDNFIINSNVNNVENLYELISDKIDVTLKNDTVSFEIIYKYNREIKSKPIIFKKELMDFQKCSNHSEFIFQKLAKNKDFKTKFNIKYVNKLLELDKGLSIYKVAKDYVDKFDLKVFNKLYKSLITSSKNNDVSNKAFSDSEELENALTEKKYSYTKQRDMYFEAYYWDKSLPNTKLIVNTYEKEDEFEDEMQLGNNGDNRLRVNGIPYEKFIEQHENTDENYEKQENYVKKHVKRRKIDDPNQIHFFH